MLIGRRSLLAGGLGGGFFGGTLSHHVSHLLGAPVVQVRLAHDAFSLDAIQRRQAIGRLLDRFAGGRRPRCFRQSRINSSRRSGSLTTVSDLTMCAIASSPCDSSIQTSVGSVWAGTSNGSCSAQVAMAISRRRLTPAGPVIVRSEFSRPRSAVACLTSENGRKQSR